MPPVCGSDNFIRKNLIGQPRPGLNLTLPHPGPSMALDVRFGLGRSPDHVAAIKAYPDAEVDPCRWDKISSYPYFFHQSEKKRWPSCLIRIQGIPL